MAFAEEDKKVRDTSGKCSGSMECCLLMDFVMDLLMIEGTDYTDGVSCVKDMAEIFKSGTNMDGWQRDDTERFIEPLRSSLFSLVIRKF